MDEVKALEEVKRLLMEELKQQEDENEQAYQLQKRTRQEIRSQTQVHQNIVDGLETKLMLSQQVLQDADREAQQAAAIIEDLRAQLQRKQEDDNNADIAKVDGVTSSLFVALYERAWEDMRLFVKEMKKSDVKKRLNRSQLLKLVYDVLFKDFAVEGFGLDFDLGRQPPKERRAEYEQVSLRHFICWLAAK
jgi:hypothetical protein